MRHVIFEKRHLEPKSGCHACRAYNPKVIDSNPPATTR